MKSKRLLLLLLLAIGLPWAANAQDLADYTLTVGTETYTSIAADNLRLTSVYGDGGYQSVTLPFSFPFGEGNYTSVTVRADGYLYFGSLSSYPGHSSKTAWTSSSYSVIAPFLNYDGKITSSGATSGAYSTTDDPDNPTMFIVEFKGLQCYYSPYGDYNFQVRLHRNGNISTVYGNSTLSTYSSASQNFFLTNGSDHICLTGSYATPVAGTPSTLPNFTTAPAEGQVITYVRPVITCPKPTNLVCTAYTATTATLSWTENGTATNWVLQYSTDNTFATGVQSVNVSNTPSKQLTGLTAETTYYARVKTDCGDGDQSDWSNTCEFMPSAYTYIGTGTSTSGYAPLYGNYNNSYDQMIYTASQLGLEASEITHIGFNSSAANSNPRTISIYMGHTTKSSFSSNSDFVSINDLTEVYSGTWNITAGWNEFELTTPFNYDGSSNLVIALYSKGSYKSTTFYYTVTSSSQVVYAYSDSNDPNPNTNEGNWSSFNSRNTTTYLPNLKLLAVVSNTPKPRNLVVSNITSEGATVTWEAPSSATPTGYEYQYKTSTGEWPAAWTNNGTNLTCTLSELTASTDYVVRVRANYADGDSDPAEIQFTTEATCMPVTNITVSDITSNSAKLAWTPGGSETNWQYLTLAHGDTPDWTSERVITSNTHANVPANIYACTGVQPQPNTEYDFYVRANCGGGDYSEAAMLTFRTACGAITSFPINYGFETSEGFPANASTPTVNPFDACWRNEATVQNGTNADRVWGTSTSYKHTGSQALVLPDKGNSTNFAKTMLVFPEMEFTYADGYIVSFWIYRNGTSTNPEGFKLYVSDCDTIGPNAVELGHYSRNYGIAYPDIVSSGWYQYETAPITRTGSVYLIFEGQSYYGNATYVDDITIKEYVAVTANQIVNTVSDPATEMTWNEFVNHWTNDDHFTSTTFTLMDDITVNTMVGTSAKPFTGIFNGNSHTITVNLTATDANFTAPFRIIRNATIQNLKVDGTINDGGFKFCAGFAGDCYGNNIFTNCESAVTINATTEGDGTHGGFIARNYGSTSTSNLCTTVFNGCAFTGRLLGANTTQSAGFCGWSEYNSPNYAKTIFNNCLFAPQAVTMSTTNSAAFARRRNASYVNFNNCYFMQDFNDGTNNTAQGKQAYTIAGVDPVYVAFSGEHTLYNMSGIDAYTEGMIHGYTKLAGEGDVVTLTLDGAPGYEANHGTLVANGETYTLTMEAFDTEITAVDCPVPFNVEANDVTATSAKIAWEGNSDTYKLMYRNVITAAVDFDETYDFEDGTLQGWTTISNDNDNHAWTIQNGTSYAHGGTKCVYAQYTSSSVGGDANDWLFSPQIPLGGTLSFYAKKSTSGTDRFQVYVSTTGNNISDFTAISEVITPNSTYDLYEYDLSSYSGYGYVAIVYTAPNDQYYIYVDDIHITATVEGEYGAWQTVNPAVSAQPISSLTPETTYQVKVSGFCNGVETDESPVVEFTTPATCPAPTELAVTDGSVTAHAATITWTENGEATTWIVEYAGNADFTGALTETVEDNTTYSFDDLDGETTYYVHVKAHCGDEDESDYSNVVNFTTLVACQAPTVLTVTEGSVTTNQVELNWTENGTATAWQICLNGDETNLIAANSNPFTLESLTAATSYTVKVRANCGGIDGESAWSNEVSFATECDVITITEDSTYRQGFEGYQGTTYSSGDVLPVCWDSYSEGSTLPHITSSGSYHYVHEGTNTLYFYGAAQTNSYVALPEFTNGLNTLQINFWMQTESGAGYGELSLGYITAEDNNFNTYQVIETYENHTSSMVEITTQIKNVPATATRLAFRWAHPSTSWHGCCIDDVEVSLLPTFTKTIAAVGEENWDGGKGGYYLIASPLAEDVDPATVNGMLTADEGEGEDVVLTYDLYSFNQAQELEWQNYRANNFNLVNGTGYLYASKNGTTLTFTGAPGTNGQVNLVYDSNAEEFAGWNLVGNPFGEDAYITKDFYTLENSDTYTPNTAGTPIHAMQGLLVVADEDGETLTFTPAEAPAGSNAKLNLNVTKDHGLIDRAIISFTEGQQLPKLQFRNGSTKVYMPKDGKEYAIVSTEAMGTMPVNFKAENNGTYTLSFTTEEVSFAYLHLIDNMTGIETDLLANPSYSFDAKTTDYESRFKLVFATGNNANDDAFAFYSNGSFVINNEGNATLQVIDVNGRILKSESINGCANVNVKAAAGVYVLRLVNGNDVKVQKVVVR